MALSSPSALKAAATDFAVDQQRLSRGTAATQKQLLKQKLFWTQRELPTLRNSGSLNLNPLRRENSALYKH